MTDLGSIRLGSLPSRTRTQTQRPSSRRLHSHFSRAIAAVAGIFVLFLAGMATAEAGDGDFGRPGFYVGLGGSYQYNVFQDRIEDVIQDALQDGGSLPPGTSVGIDIDDSGGLNIMAGYRVFSWFAIELEYDWVSEYEVGATTNIPGVAGDLYSIEGHSLTANTKWIVPTWRIQPYFVLGGGFAVSDVDRGNVYGNAILGPVLVSAGVDPKNGKRTAGAGKAGLGVDLYITENIVVNAEASVVLTTLKKPDVGDIDDLNYMSFGAGMQYRF